MTESKDRAETGQSTVEVVAIIPAVLLVALLLFQVLSIGYTLTLVDGAAASGAIAIAGGESAEAAVRRALPGWAGDRASVRSSGGRVEVSIDAPSVVPGISGLELNSTAAVASG